MKAIAYYRVSTRSQGRSGLGLAAQEDAVLQWAKSAGARILDKYTEVESGSRSDRTALAAALSHCRRTRAVLVVGKIDRVSRKLLDFLTILRDSRVRVIDATDPNATEDWLTLRIWFAERELGLIRTRTRDALATARTGGKLLGGANPRCRNLTNEARRRGIEHAAEANRRNREEAYADVAPIVRELRGDGLSLRAIAAELNRQEVVTRRGKAWSATQVKRLLDAA